MKMKSEDESKQNLTSCFNPRLVPIHCGCPCQFRDGWWKELANKGCNERLGWAGLGWARWRAHTQSCRGVNACHRHLQHLQHLQLSQSAEICSHHDMQLQFEDVTAVWGYLQTICSCDGQQLKMWHNHKLQWADMTHETETKLQNNLSTLLNWWKDRIKKTIFYIYI